MSTTTYSTVAKNIGTKNSLGYSTVPQTEPIPGSNQVANSGGGYSYQLDDWKRLKRFLTLGSEGNTFYATGKELATQNANNIIKLIKDDGIRAVSEIKAVSVAGKAPKNDAALFALALCATHGDNATKSAAYAALPEVARIGTHIFQFVDFLLSMRGVGRGPRRAISNWYASKPAYDLAYQVIKYRERNKWSHKRLLDLFHPIPATPEHNEIFNWIERGWESVGSEVHSNDSLVQIWAFEKAKNASTGQEICNLIREHNLPREAVPSNFLNDASVWEALLEKMPMTAMIRNLATLTRIGVISPLSSGSKRVISQLGNTEALRKARIHPLTLLCALKVYEQGHGEKSDNTWKPLQVIIDALNDAFYKSFDFVESTGKNFLIGLDISGSMGMSEIAKMPGITPRIASAALAMVTARTESNYHILGYSHKLVDINISPSMRLDAVIKKISNLEFGATDCALPMLWARGYEASRESFSWRQKTTLTKSSTVKDVDVFVSYTDNETFFGSIHPSEALKRYRQESGKDARSIVVGMTATNFSIASPDDPFSLDICGMSTDTPTLISSFAKGEI